MCLRRVKKEVLKDHGCHVSDKGSEEVMKDHGSRVGEGLSCRL